MSRNSESYFATLPHIDIPRSRFDRSYGHKFSADIGQLIPFFVDEILPGDTVSLETGCVVRLQTLLTPIMDNIYLDLAYYFVPSRVVCKTWEEIMGENKESAWYPETEHFVPQIESPDGGWNVGTIADYMGIPPGVEFSEASGLTLSAIPFRGYAMICDQFYRDQNVSDPLLIPFDETTQSGSNGDQYVTDVANGGKPFLAAKFHDLFSSCLPSPQKGPPVTVGAAWTPGTNLLPVMPSKDKFNVFPYDGEGGSVNDRTPMIMAYNVGKSALDPGGMPDYYSTIGSYWKIVSASGDPQTLRLGTATTSVPFLEGGGSWSTPNTSWDEGHTSSYNDLYPVNLFADAANLGFGIGINELRLAFQLQKFYEKNARGGTRYRELLKMHFSVTSPDARFQIPEYLGGKRFPLSIHQVTNQAQTETEYLGDLGAMSNTYDSGSGFIKSFTEHGYLIGVCVARYDHSYPQGLERFWTRKSATDFYFPVFANIGEQPVYKYEIDASVREGEDRNAVFGYNEAWCQYRFKPSRVSGELRPGIPNSLSHWHLADYYTQQPALSDSWIREDKSNVDRVLAVTSSVANQYFCDFWFKYYHTRPLPAFSIPGLIDHH